MKRPWLVALGGGALLAALGIGAVMTAAPAGAGPVVTVYKTPT